MRFRAKIILGFVAVLGIEVISMGITHFGFGRISEGIMSYQEIVAEADAARDIDRELAAYQLLVRYYVLTGFATDQAAAHESERQLGEAIRRAETVASAANQHRIITLSAKYSEFKALFTQAIGIKTENAGIASSKLLRLGNFFRYKLEELAEAAAAAGQGSLQAAVKETSIHVAAASGSVGNYIVKPDQAVANSAIARIRLLKSNVSTLTSSDLKLANKIREIIDQLIIYDEVFAKYVDNVGTVEELAEKIAMPATGLAGDAKGIKNDLLARQQLVSDQSVAIAHDIGKFVAMLGAGGVVLGGLLAWLLGQGISRPMIGMCTAMRKLAGGSFEVVLPGLGRRDEIGEMASAVEEFKVQAIAKAEREASEREVQNSATEDARRAELGRFAENFEGAVGGIVSNVASSANQLESAAATLTRTVDGTQKVSGRVASASEEASSSVQSVASATEELSASVKEIGRQVRDSSRIAMAAVTQAEHTDSRIEELSRAAQQIGKVVKLITAIAEQTNLLALNATIEAARAGQAAGLR